MSEPEITQAQMDKYFETGGKETPPAIVEAEKLEAEPEAPVEAPKATEPPKAEPKAVEPPKADGEVQVNVDGKMVPLAELMEERRSRQAAQQLASQQQQQLTEMLALVKEKAKGMTQEEQTAAPDPNSDPFGYINHILGNVQQTTQELQAWRQQQDNLARQQATLQQYSNWAQAKENEFTQSQKDYPQAYKYAAEQREHELAAIYPDPAIRQQILQQDQQAIVNEAIRQGKNPAQLVYEYAKAKGYKAEIVAAQKPVPDLDDKVRTIAKGQEAARTTSGSGSAPTEINNLQDLAAASSDMSDDEFSKAFDKLAGKMKGKYV